MPIPIGAEVIVGTLANRRGEVVAAGRDGRYQVRVGGATIWCREQDLAPVPARKSKRGTRQPATPPLDASRFDVATAGRVDLHGLTVAEGLARVVDEIDRALRRGADRVEVLHGKGTGRLKEALHRHLATMPVVAAFKLDPRNAGVTWVYF
jgi:DNA mismatch repair protein MutS2